METPQTGLKGLTVMLISMIAGGLAGFVSFMDTHQWAAVIFAAVGAAIVTTTGNFVYKARADRYKQKLIAAERELKEYRRARAAAAVKRD